ncbi:unnamed protein product [Lactuca virosa]|uniref:Uncharacterized protein n=1 Tax=Lactuca virosa TaxID=75947 RepID=A0AAU9PKF6_9ASTR|nr:unnamed protein product [Lactuca virosa]
MHEWLEEHKEEIVDNIVEEVINGAGQIKEIETGHLDEDEDENEDEDDDKDEDDHRAEDVDADEDEDDHTNPHFFKKDNGPDVDMGENAALGDPLEEAMDDDEDVYPQLPNIFNEKLHWKEQEPVLVMRVNESEQVVRVNEAEQVGRVNQVEELGRVNQVVGHVYTTGQPSKRKK